MRRDASSSRSSVRRRHDRSRRGAESQCVRTGFINGLPGFVTLEADGEMQTTTLDIDDGRITAIYVMRNPDKLKHLH